ncbi:MAG TPA: rRNA methyltransferase, partial [Sporichthyaceae bacterium]|nr:rRNA methyltransferase [Sporichthyaceae bacterium]
MVLVTPACADPLYRRSVRTSMGTVFQVRWTRLNDLPGDLTLLHDAGFVTVALTPAESTVAATTHRARIPMAAGVDSLNVAAAAAVACYALR